MTMTARTRQPTAAATQGGMALTGVAAADTRTAHYPAGYPATVNYLFGSAVVRVLLWWTTSRAHLAGRSWTRPMATTVFVVAIGLAVFDLAALLPLGVIGLLPSAAVLISVVGVWRRPAPAELCR